MGCTRESCRPVLFHSANDIFNAFGIRIGKFAPEMYERGHNSQRWVDVNAISSGELPHFPANTLGRRVSGTRILFNRKMYSRPSRSGFSAFSFRRTVPAYGVPCTRRCWGENAEQHQYGRRVEPPPISECQAHPTMDGGRTGRRDGIQIKFRATDDVL